MSLFWENDTHQVIKKPTIKEAKAWTTYHCPDDGTNLRYSPGDMETRCTHCGQQLSLVQVKWRGQS